jgi:hypothetical protein
MNIRNNIFVAENGAVFMTIDDIADFVSDFNDLSGTPTVAIWKNQTLNSLADYQAATGQDLHSLEQDPFLPVGPGSGVWTHITDLSVGSGVADLHFSAFPGDIYYAPRFDPINSDFDQESRTGTMAIMGADEVPNPHAGIIGWAEY